MSQTTETHELTLYHFRYSMFPEKVRWALDFKQIPHQRVALLPGIHPATLLPLAKQKCVPVLCTGTEVLTESSTIIAWLETHYPQPALFSENPKQRAQMDALISEFDDIGPHARRAYFHELLKSPDYAAQLFCYGHPERSQRRYRRFFPLVKGVMRADMQITNKRSQHSKQLLEKGLDRVAALSRETGYLIGDSFSAADLTAATVLNLALLPPEYPVPLPQPYPEPLQHWLAEWQGHPGLDYVARMYREHRGISAATSDLPSNQKAA